MPKITPLNLRQHVLILVLLAGLLAIIASTISYQQGSMVAYGDAESHLNISKRVIDSLTPGLAQLGGIWLPLPHLLMVPFTAIDVLWYTGIAGAIVSGAAYVLASYFLFLLIHIFTQKFWLSWLGVLAFLFNPNILYLQSTAMTELPLIAFFLGSIYYFTKFLTSKRLFYLILAAFLGLAGSLSRYDGWFLIGMQLLLLFAWYLPIFINHTKKHGLRGFFSSPSWREYEGYTLVFGVLGFVGVLFWLVWDYLILNDPFYFTNSPFSAKSQQLSWLAQGMLPAYHDLTNSWLYYQATSLANIGWFISLAALSGLLLFLLIKPRLIKIILSLLLVTPFIFYVITLYLGQSVIFIPQLTPDWFEWQMFNVRYGVLMVASAGFFFAICIDNIHKAGSWVLRHYSPRSYLPVYFSAAIGILLLGLQTTSFLVGYEPVVSLQDGVSGLSAGSHTDAQEWIREQYDHGLILLDDYARTMSIVRARIPMERVIYVGTKPYWEESLINPQTHARWIIMQKDDSVWSELVSNPAKEDQLYAHFEKVYTSPEILIFRRSNSIAAQ